MNIVLVKQQSAQAHRFEVRLAQHYSRMYRAALIASDAKLRKLKEVVTIW